MSYYCISQGFYEISPALGKKEQEEFDRLAECYYWRVVDGGRHLAPMQENVWHIWDDFEHLMETFFERKGYLLNGVVVWKGENFYDIGECRVENNERNYFYGKELFEEVKDLSLRFLASDSEEDFPFALRGLQDTPARRRHDRYYYTEVEEVHLNFSKPLKKKDRMWLSAYAATDHHRRNGLPKEYGRGGELYVSNNSDDEDFTCGQRAGECPDLVCPWKADLRGRRLEIIGEQERFDLCGGECSALARPVEWLDFLLMKVFSPKGYVLNGYFFWKGEEIHNAGVCLVHDNRIYPARLPLAHPRDTREYAGGYW